MILAQLCNPEKTFSVIRVLGIGINEETKPIINEFIEKSNEEKIPFGDFLNLYDLLNEHKKTKEEEEEELLRAFEFFDGEGSGFIEEIKINFQDI